MDEQPTVIGLPVMPPYPAAQGRTAGRWGCYFQHMGTCPYTESVLLLQHSIDGDGRPTAVGESYCEQCAPANITAIDDDGSRKDHLARHLDQTGTTSVKLRLQRSRGVDVPLLEAFQVAQPRPPRPPRPP